VHAYVINMARSLDRRAHITKELNKTGLDWEIVIANDGRDLDLQDPAVVHPSLLTSTPFPAGMAGGSSSHVLAYKKIVADGLDKALVLEDDAVLPVDLGDLIDAAADHMTDAAEIVLLSYDNHEPSLMSREGSINLPSERVLALPIDLFQLKSAGAYIITREACERLIKCAVPARGGADMWGLFYQEGALDRVRCVVPIPVFKEPKLESTIGSYRLGTGVRARLIVPLVRRKIPLLQQVILYRRRRIYRQWSQVEFVDMPFAEKPSRLD
jgi:glycosyl transferase, family 25